MMKRWKVLEVRAVEGRMAWRSAVGGSPDDATRHRVRTGCERAGDTMAARRRPPPSDLQRARVDETTPAALGTLEEGESRRHGGELVARPRGCTGVVLTGVYEHVQLQDRGEHGDGHLRSVRECCAWWCANLRGEVAELRRCAAWASSRVPHLALIGTPPGVRRASWQCRWLLASTLPRREASDSSVSRRPPAAVS